MSLVNNLSSILSSCLHCFSLLWCYILFLTHPFFFCLCLLGRFLYVMSSFFWLFFGRCMVSSVAPSILFIFRCVIQTLSFFYSLFLPCLWKKNLLFLKFWLVIRWRKKDSLKTKSIFACFMAKKWSLKKNLSSQVAWDITGPTAFYHALNLFHDWVNGHSHSWASERTNGHDYGWASERRRLIEQLRLSERRRLIERRRLSEHRGLSEQPRRRLSERWWLSELQKKMSHSCRSQWLSNRVGLKSEPKTKTEPKRVNRKYKI